MQELIGAWPNKDGTVHTRALLVVNISATGTLTDPGTGQPLVAERWGTADIVTNGMWRFSPDAGELERIGACFALRSSAHR